MTIWSVSTVCLVFVVNDMMVKGQDDHHIRRLHQDLIDTNNAMIRPVRNSSHGTVIQLMFNIVTMSEVDEISQTITANGYFQVNWIDEFLRWNASDYGDVKMITPLFTKVWHPQITVQNSVDKTEPLGLTYAHIRLMSDGGVTWVPGQTFRTYCKMDVFMFPFDMQTCTYSVLVWGLLYPSIDIKVPLNSIGLNIYKENSEWEIMYTSARRRFSDTADGLKFPIADFNMTLKRKPSSKVLTVIVPVVVLNLLNTAVFLIPVVSGEKLSFSITVLLSFAVFMSFLINMLPQSSDSLSLFAIYLDGLLVVSALYVVLTVWIIHLYHRDPTLTPVPRWMRRTTRALERVLFCNGVPTVGSVDVKSPGSTNEASTPQRVSGSLFSWERVSKTADRTFFWLFLSSFLLTTIAVLMKITIRHI